MSAQPVAEHSHPLWQPDPARQRRADYTLNDVLDLPHDTPRVELSHGVMLVVPSPSESHQIISSRLWNWLDTYAPERYLAVPAVGVAVAPNHVLEPDVLLRHADDDVSRHYVAPEQAVLVVEVVSPGTRARDRFTKPAEYAAAGIGFYWRVEQDPLHIYAYQLTADGTYELVADSTDILELTEPFPIKLAVAELAPGRRVRSAER